MKFHTRKLYNSMQSESRRAESAWKKAGKDYLKYYNSIKNSLPKGIKEFSKLTLHDAVIKSVAQVKDRLILEIDGRGCCWGPVGQFKLVFSGLKSVKGAKDIINDIWLYEEIYLSDVGKFEYHVLLWKSELSVVADEVEFRKVKG